MWACVWVGGEGVGAEEIQCFVCIYSKICFISHITLIAICISAAMSPTYCVAKTVLIASREPTGITRNKLTHHKS